MGIHRSKGQGTKFHGIGGYGRVKDERPEVTEWESMGLEATGLEAVGAEAVVPLPYVSYSAV